ncbi:MAG: hypothetical protein WD431_17725 [Cyclobacteriaceae bacterium]
MFSWATRNFFGPTLFSFTKEIPRFSFKKFQKPMKTPIHFRLAGFGVKKSGLWVGKGRGMFDEGFWLAMPFF